MVAPSLIPKKPGDRVKTDRRDAINLAKLHRAGELTAVWVPDQAHEAIRDLVRARLAAVRTLRKARQQRSGFLLRRGRHYGQKAWTHLHRRWLAGLKFEQPVHYIVLEDCLEAVDAATARLDRLEAHIEAALPDLVSRTGRAGTSGIARRGHGGGGNTGCRTRRHHPLHQTKPAHGISWLGSV